MKRMSELSGQGHLGGTVFEHLPLAQIVTPESWDRVPYWFLAGSLLLPLPVSLPLSISHE